MLSWRQLLLFEKNWLSLYDGWGNIKTCPRPVHASVLFAASPPLAAITILLPDEEEQEEEELLLLPLRPSTQWGEKKEHATCGRFMC